MLYAVDVQRAFDHAVDAALAANAGGAAGAAGSTDGAGSLNRPGSLGDLLQAIDVRPLVRPAVVVPERKPADDLLDEMRRTRHYFAVVVDEYGGTAGVVTVEDLLAALVGPLPPEAAAGADEPDVAAAAVVAAPDGSLLLDGLLRLDQWQEATGVPLDAPEPEGVETIGGLVMERLGRIPAIGDEVAVGRRVLRVEQLDGMRAARVRLLAAGQDVSAANAA